MSDKAVLTEVDTGAARIAAERQRQIDVEGYTAKHDDNHRDGSLVLAAACYAAGSVGVRLYKQDTRGASIHFVDPWPWERSADRRYYASKSSDKLREPTLDESIRLLEKAGALIAAEIDTLLREKAIQAKAQTKTGGCSEVGDE